MFRSRYPLFNFVMNFLISCGIFWLFSQIGWITISSAQPLWVIVLVVILVNLVVSLVLTFGLILLLPVIAILAFCTLGLGVVVISGAFTYAVFYITGSLTGLFVMTTIWWQALVIGIAFSLLRFSTPSN